MEILLINPYDSPDYLYRDILEGLLQLDVKLYFTNPDRFCTNLVSDDEAIALSKTVNYILVFFDKEKLTRPQPKFYLLDRINLPEKTAYIDGSEYNWTAYPGKTTDLLRPDMLYKCKFYFKRECLPQHVDMGIIPLPFASNLSYFSNKTHEKDIDVLCTFGQTSTGQRAIAIHACNELKQEGYHILTDNVTDYYSYINRSWITIDAHGGGECNARTWQILANHSCLFAEKYNIVMPKLVDGYHYVSWNDKEDLKNKIRIYLGNKEKLSYIIQNSYDNVLKHHTSRKRAEYLIIHLTKQ
jgi:hypothetical protein